MIPILYGPQETAFTSNGICRLIDAITCEVTEERNGIYELEMTYSVTGRNYEKILEGCIIYVTHDDSRVPQPFDIYKRSVPIDGIVTFYASHISYRLNKMVLSPYVAITCADAFAQIPSHTIGVDNPFSFWTNKVVTSASPFSVTYPKAIKNALGGSEGSILDVFGTGEYEFDKWAVKFHQHRGTDTELVIRYGKNMTDLTDESDVGGTNNGVAPYWAGGDAGVVMLPEQWISSGGWQMYGEDWTTYTGDTMTNERGETLEWTYSPNEIIPLDLSGEFSEAPTQAQLRQKAVSLFNQSESWLGTRTIEVDFVKLSDTDEYADVAPLQDVLLCDTVTIVHDGVSVRVKVVKTTYDSLLDRYTKLELGDAKLTFGMMIKDGAITAATAGVTALINAATQRMADTITGANGGNIVIRYQDGWPYELLILDAESTATAVNVWKWDKGGLSHSSDGYDGEYPDIAITADGKINANLIKVGTINADLIRSGSINADLITSGHINADLITAGTMLADRIRAGTLSSVDGTTYWNLNTGVFYNTNAANTKGTRISDAEMRFYIGSTIVARLGTYNVRDLDTQTIIDQRFSVAAAGKSMSLGFWDSTQTYLVPHLTINNGDNPHGLEEDVIVNGDLATIRTINVYRTDSGVITRSFGIDFGNSSGTLNETDIRFAYRQRVNIVGYSFEQASPPTTKSMMELYPSSGGTVIYTLAVGSQNFGPTGTSYVMYVTGNAYFTANISAQSVTQRSDITLKNVHGWDPRYLELLDRIDPILFDWKEEDDDTTHIGYSAQDVQKEMDALGIDGIVSKEGEYLSINYAELSTLLQAKVKQQQKRIDELEKRLEKAEGMIEKLCEFLSYQS